MLDDHQATLNASLHTALAVAAREDQLRTGLDLAATAEHLSLLAYAINLRSRAGAQPDRLRTAIDAALAPLST